MEANQIPDKYPGSREVTSCLDWEPDRSGFLGVSFRWMTAHFDHVYFFIRNICVCSLIHVEISVKTI